MPNKNLTEELTHLLEETKTILAVSEDDLYKFDGEDEFGEEESSNKRKFILYGMVLLILSAVFAVLWKNLDTLFPSPTMPVASPAAPTNLAAPAAPLPQAPVANAATVTAEMDAELQKILNDMPLKDDTLAKAPPLDATVAAEEIDRLADEAARRQAQAATLQKTAQTTEAMIALKEKQLAQLKAELAKIDAPVANAAPGQ